MSKSMADRSRFAKTVTVFAIVFGIGLGLCGLSYVLPSSDQEFHTNRLGEVSLLIIAKCGEHSFELAIPAFRDTVARVIARGGACLAKEEPENQEYSAFLAKAFNQGVVLDYVSDNAVLIALAREQTELYRLLSTRGGIPLSLDLSTHFEGGIIGKMWNVAASHSTVTTKRISTFPLGAVVIEVPASITPTEKDH